MSYTYDQLSKIVDEATQNVIEPVNEQHTIADYMNKSFNMGVRIMGSEILLMLAKMETESLRKAGESA